MLVVTPLEGAYSNYSCHSKNQNCLLNILTSMSTLQLEKSTGRKVTELFDWIVGSSTGGIVALGLVYGVLYYD